MKENIMDEAKLKELSDRVAVLRLEVEALAGESGSFPAIWRNAVRMEACVRMMEINLGDDAAIPFDFRGKPDRVNERITSDNG